MKVKLLVISSVALATGIIFSAGPFPNKRVVSGQLLAAEQVVPDPLCTKAGQYCVNREPSSGTCHVQEATEMPQFGRNLKGPIKNRAEGNKIMCGLYEPASEDPTKCAAVAPQGVCDPKSSSQHISE